MHNIISRKKHEVGLLNAHGMEITRCCQDYFRWQQITKIHDIYRKYKLYDFFKQKEKEILTKFNWQYYKCGTFLITVFSHNFSLSRNLSVRQARLWLPV